MNSKRLSNWAKAAFRGVGVLLAAAGLIWPTAAIAEVEGSGSVHARGWKSVGPAPPTVAAPIAALPAFRTIYVNTRGGGLFKSTNGGSSFVGLENSIRGASSLAVDPRDPNVVYVGGFKSIDGGETWNFMEGGGDTALVMDPSNPDVLYGLEGEILKTVDAGATWFSAGEGVPAPASLAINPFDTDVLYAGTHGEGAFKSVDGGVSWNRIDVDPTVLSLLVDPTNGNIVYAGTNGNGVYKSIDGGASFVRIGSPRRGIVFSLAKSGDKLYAATDLGGAEVSRDGGATWQNTGAAEGRGLALSTDSAGVLYLGTNLEGAFVLPGDHHPSQAPGQFEDVYSSKGSQDSKWRRLGWKQLRDCACQQGLSVAIDPSDREHLFFAADGGLLETENGGRTWEDGNRHGIVAGAPSVVVFDPQQPRRVYAGSIGNGLFKSVDHGKHWVRRSFGFGNQIIIAMDVDPVDHSVYVGTVFADGIWKSTDFGDTFTRIDRAPDAPPGEFLDLSGRGITVDPNNHNTVYFADRGTGTWRSQDAGASWINVDSTQAQNVTVDPTDSSIVYAGSLFMGVLKSTDGGASFNRMSNGLPDPMFMPPAGGVRVSPAHNNVLYVGAEFDGVFKSTDGGESWGPVSLGLDGVRVTGLVMDPVDPSVLYAGTSESVYKTSTGGE